MRAKLVRITTSCLSVAFFAVLALTLSGTSHAAVAGRQIPLTARVLDPNTRTLVADGTYTVRYAIYTNNRTTSDPYPSDADSSTRLWSETKSVNIKNGILFSYLGSDTPFPDSLDFSSNDLYIGIRINTDPELVPRRKLGAVPLAISADNVQGKTPGTGPNSLLSTDSNGGIAFSGTPLANSTTSFVSIGGSIQGGNASTNGGTYLGINAPASGAGSAADFINFQNNGSAKLQVTNDGSLLANGDITIGAGGSLKLTGGAAFPASPTEGQVFFRTDKHLLYTFADGQWDAGKDVASFTVAAPDSINQSADFHATGTDDQNAINAAIDALPSNGGIIYLHDGTFNTTDSIVIAQNNVTLVGAGAGTIIRRTGGSTNDIITVGNGGFAAYSAITVANIKMGSPNASIGVNFNGKVSNSTVRSVIFDSHVGYSVISLTAASAPNADNDNIIADNTITNSSDTNAIQLSNSANNLISGNHGIKLIELDNASNSNRIVNNDIAQGSGFAQILVWQGSADNTVIGNTLNGGSPTIGPSIYVRAASHNTVSGNTILSSNWQGISIGVGATDNTISNNVIDSPTQEGILIDVSSAHNIVTGNSIYVTSNGGFNLINIKGTSTNNLISSNILTSTGLGSHISIEAGSTNNTLSSNTFAGSSTAISDSESSTIYNGQLTGNNDLILQAANDIGVNTTTPGRRLAVLDTTNPQLRLNSSGSDFVDVQKTASAMLIITGSSLASTSGTDYGLKVLPTINQTSGTAGYTALLVNATESATGSGTKNLLDLQVGTVSKFSISSTGHIKSSQATAPTSSFTLADCGTGPSTSVVAGSTDAAGSFIITAGTGGPGACTVQFNFNVAYGAAPKSIVLSPATTTAGAKNLYVSSVIAADFIVKMATAPAASESNTWYYWVVE